MRVILFRVKGQVIERDMSNDIGVLVAGTSGYISAKFVFSEDWLGCSKVVGFFDKDDNELTPCALDKDGICEIPADALKYHEFKIRVYGKRGSVRITTRPITIKQYGGI